MAVINSLRALKGVTAPEELKKGDGFTISPQLLANNIMSISQ